MDAMPNVWADLQKDASVQAIVFYSEKPGNFVAGADIAMLAKAKTGETVLFSYIVYKSRKHRDRVNKKVMADERLHAMCNPKNAPFDFKRMAYGGFKAMIDLH